MFSLQKFSYNTNIYTEEDLWKIIDSLDKEFIEIFSYLVTSILEFNSDYIKKQFPSSNSDIKKFIPADNLTYKKLKEKLENLADREFKYGAYGTVNHVGARPTTTDGGFPPNVINTAEKLRSIAIKYKVIARRR